MNFYARSNIQMTSTPFRKTKINNNMSIKLRASKLMRAGVDFIFLLESSLETLVGLSQKHDNYGKIKTQFKGLVMTHLSVRKISNHLLIRGTYTIESLKLFKCQLIRYMVHVRAQRTRINSNHKNYLEILLSYHTFFVCSNLPLNADFLQVASTQEKQLDQWPSHWNVGTLYFQFKDQRF